MGLIAVSLLAALAGAAVTAVAVRDAVYWEKPLPGVALADVDLGRSVRVVVDGENYDVRPEEALRVDRRATQAALVQAGHDSFLRRVRQLGRPEPTGARSRPRARAAAKRSEPGPATLARTPAASASAGRLSRGVVLDPALAAGRRRRGQDLLSALEQAARTGARTLSPELTHVEPTLTTPAAEAAVAEAQTLVDEPVALTFKGEDVGSLSPAQLARLVRFWVGAESFRVGFDPKRVAKAVEPLLAQWRQKAVNARFIVEGKRVRIRPSRPGLAVDGKWVADSVAAAASSSFSRASLRLKQIRADVTTDEAQKLGIRQQISTFTTDMGPSSSNRIHNVQLMANYIDGTIVRPGEAFSFNKSVGPRTPERGFREGQMIIGSLLLPAIGGGVCQTATTLFNNAFELGLPIVERHNHSFYISHYPMGRDATVSWGGPDFAFRNDLKTGILIKTSYTSSTLTFSFYGTDPGRRVVSATGERTNWRSPRTTYALDPYAPRGSVRTVSGSNQSGFDVTVSRKVYEHGKLKRRDAFKSAYIAVGPTQIYGPGRSIPGPYFVLPRV